MTKTAQKVTEAMTEQATAAAEAGKAAFAKASERTQAAMEKAIQAAGELNNIARENYEALVSSGRVAAKGYESLAQKMGDYGRKHVEDSTSLMRALRDVRSPMDLFKLQSDFAREQMAHATAEYTKLNEMLRTLADDVAQPLKKRATDTYDKLSKTTKG